MLLESVPQLTSWHTPFPSSPLAEVSAEETPLASPIMVQPQWTEMSSLQGRTYVAGVKRRPRKEGEAQAESWVNMEVPKDDGFGLIGELYLCPFKVAIAIAEELVYQFKF
jgi:hypothetical protein